MKDIGGNVIGRVIDIHNDKRREAQCAELGYPRCHRQSVGHVKRVDSSYEQRSIVLSEGGFSANGLFVGAATNGKSIFNFIL